MNKSSVKQVSVQEWIMAIFIAIITFMILGSLTALWDNPFFVRMTPYNWFDFVILGIESILFGLLLGIKSSVCVTKKASIGGILGFLGFGCSICNKFLLLLFGSSFLLTYFEPIRQYIGIIGIVLLSMALYQKHAVKLSSNSL